MVFFIRDIYIIIIYIILYKFWFICLLIIFYGKCIVLVFKEIEIIFFLCVFFEKDSYIEILWILNLLIYKNIFFGFYCGCW